MSDAIVLPARYSSIVMSAWASSRRPLSKSAILACAPATNARAEISSCDCTSVVVSVEVDLTTSIVGKSGRRDLNPRPPEPHDGTATTGAPQNVQLLLCAV